LEAVMVLYASMRNVRRFKRDLHLASLQISQQPLLARMGSALRECYGLQDEKETVRHRQEMTELLQRWTAQKSIGVRKLSTTDELRAKALQDRITQQRRAAATARQQRLARDLRKLGG
jgi:hypothetical protein